MHAFPSPRSWTKVVAALGRGDLLGWSALIGRRSAGATWKVTARVARTCNCLGFPGAALYWLCEHDHDFGYVFMPTSA